MILQLKYEYFNYANNVDDPEIRNLYYDSFVLVFTLMSTVSTITVKELKNGEKSLL